jgi:hypothetical protein
MKLTTYLHMALALCLDVGEDQFLEKKNCRAPITFTINTNNCPNWWNLRVIALTWS